jgi:GLPGLI family protein
MNKIFLISLLFFGKLLFSQSNSGIIYYKVDVNRSKIIKKDTIISDDDREIANHFTAIFKKSFEKKFELSYNDSISIFKEKAELVSSSANSNLYGKSNNDKLYINIKNLEYNNQIEFFGKIFLITDSINMLKWHIDKKQFKYIFDKKVYKATCKKIINNKVNNIIAWYTEEIPHGFGPDLYCGLPGLILELDTGNITYLCEKISFSKEIIKKPNSGKKVTQQEFDVISNQKQIEILGFKK